MTALDSDFRPQSATAEGSGCSKVQNRIPGEDVADPRGLIEALHSWIGEGESQSLPGPCFLRLRWLAHEWIRRQARLFLSDCAAAGGIGCTNVFLARQS